MPMKNRRTIPRSTTHHAPNYHSRVSILSGLRDRRRSTHWNHSTELESADFQRNLVRQRFTTQPRQTGRGSRPSANQQWSNQKENRSSLQNQNQTSVVFRRRFGTSEGTPTPTRTQTFSQVDRAFQNQTNPWEGRLSSRDSRWHSSTSHLEREEFTFLF